MRDASRRLTPLRPSQPQHGRRSGLPGVSAAAGIAALTGVALAAFAPVLHNGFVNWDDPTVIVDNSNLGRSSVFAWAFSTTLIGHYQPLAWLVWSAAAWLFGKSAPAFHALSLAGHVANAWLVYALTRRLVDDGPLAPVQRHAAGLIAAAIFLLHPSSVETVAWASAFPYILSLGALLVSCLAYLDRRPGLALGCYAASLLIRPIAIGFPVVVALVYLVRSDDRRTATFSRTAGTVLPFAALASAAAIVEWRSRDVATFHEVGLGSRFTMAVAAPFVYLGRILWPVRLSPLDPLPMSPSFELLPFAAGLVGLLAATLGAWMLRRRRPLAAAAWVAYLALLAPVAGLTPSGLQATADRYLYAPSVVVSVSAGATLARLLAPTARGVLVAPMTAAALLLLGTSTWRQTHYWRDSIALWTRAAELDPQNDVATYNLAIALADAGREDDAVRRYEQTLALVPDHDLARRDLDRIRASRAERDGDRLAAAGDLDAAADRYAQAIGLDANRPHTRASLGMVLVRRGRFRDAAEQLTLAVGGGVTDPDVANALGFALVQTGEASRAVEVLGRAQSEHPDDINLTHNLARLLATAQQPRVRDGERALRLALDVCERTANRDPRALDTLAAAYAAAGQVEQARAAALRAIARARELGDERTAAEIAAHAAAFGR